MARARHRRDGGFLVVLLIVLLIVLTFLFAIFWSWEAPVPSRQVIKDLPEAALLGGAAPIDGSGLSEPSPRYVGIINVPTRQVDTPDVANAPRARGLVPAGSEKGSSFDDGPITIDLRDD